MKLFRNSKQKNKKEKRIGRGGKRGTTSGRGTKGQKSRAGHRIRPAERDLLIRLPKLRGFKHKSFKNKSKIVNIGNLEKFSDTVLNLQNLGDVKILGKGKLNKIFTIEGLKISKGAKKKIEEARGKIIDKKS